MLVTVAIVCQLSDNFSENQNLAHRQLQSGFTRMLGDVIALTGSVVSAHLF